MILIFNAAGYRLCQDNRWRSFANYGDYPECVKIYRSLGAAINKAKRINGVVVLLEEGFEVDAGGSIMETVNGKTVHHNFKEFVVREKEIVHA